MALVEDKYFASNTVSFTGLTGSYVYVCYIAGGAAGAGDMTILFNNSVLPTSYYREEILADGAVMTSEYANDNSIGAMTAAGVHTWEVTIGGDHYSNNMSYHVRQMANIGAAIKERLLTGTSGAAAITKITFTSDVNFVGRAILYRLAPR
jgi:hypothetical protein